MIYLLAALGLVMLVAGGDLLVRGAVTVAEKLGVSSMIIGLTVVGFGTSLPELVTSLQAASQGADGMALGNVIGSNVANILLILGVTALLCPFPIDEENFKANAAMLSLSTIACAVLCMSGTVSRPEGMLLVATLAVYLALLIRTERRRLQEAELPGDIPNPLLPIDSPSALVVGQFPSGTAKAVISLVGGLTATLLGAHLLVKSSIGIARMFEISEVTIGATVIAVGTSLPELVTCSVAAWKKQLDIAFGNIVGSNIFNVFGILGITAVVHPLDVSTESLGLESGFLVGATVGLLAIVLFGYRISRLNGVLLVGAYVGFIALLLVGR